MKSLKDNNLIFSRMNLLINIRSSLRWNVSIISFQYSVLGGGGGGNDAKAHRGKAVLSVFIFLVQGQKSGSQNSQQR